MLALFMLGLAVIAAALILGVVFGPDQRDDSYVRVKGEPLAIEAPPCVKPREVAYVGVWDEVDQHWGETQWMTAVG